MLDPLTQQLGIGGAVAVVLVATVLKFLPAFMMALRRNGNSSQKYNGNDHSKIAVLESEMLAMKDEVSKLRERVHELANRIQALVTIEELRKRSKE